MHFSGTLPSSVAEVCYSQSCLLIYGMMLVHRLYFTHIIPIVLSPIWSTVYIL